MMVSPATGTLWFACDSVNFMLELCVVRIAWMGEQVKDLGFLAAVSLGLSTQLLFLRFA